MTNTVERARLYRGIVKHVLEDDGLTYLKLVIKTPCRHPVTRETAVTTKAVEMRTKASPPALPRREGAAIAITFAIKGILYGLAVRMP